MDELVNFLLNHLGSVTVGGGGLLAAVMTVIQVSKIEINPWSWLAKTIGNALNADVMDKIGEIQLAQEDTRKKLEEHIEESEEREAGNYKSRVLRFNNELVRGLGHTEEEYNEMFDVIWKYETHCKTHPNYKNNRMPHAIKNIERMYDVMLATNGFLKTED